MMKRLLLLFCALAALASPARGGGLLIGSGVGSTVTNYTSNQNCVGAWFLNSDTTDSVETDRSTNENNLTISDPTNMARETLVPSGYHGYSKDFRGSPADLLTIADGTELDINGTGAKISVCTWFYVDSIGLDDEQIIVSKYSITYDNRQYLLYLTGTGSNVYQIFFSLSDDGSSIVAVNSTTANYGVGVWHHVCATSDNINIRLYVDGVEDANASKAFTGGIFNGTADFNIGSYSSTYGAFNGNIDEAIVFNDAISSTDVSNIYTYGIDGTKGGND